MDVDRDAELRMRVAALASRLAQLERTVAQNLELCEGMAARVYEVRARVASSNDRVV